MSVGLTLIASYIHHHYILKVKIDTTYQYVVPLIVGLLFGITFSLLIHLYLSLKEKERKLEELATIDDLTRLPNKRSIQEHLVREFNRAKRKGSPLSVAVMDLDDFKWINDTYGHLVGDRILREFASILRKNLRVTDIVGRFGGDELIIIMPETDLKMAINTVERLRRVIESATFKPVGNLTVSVGVTELREGDTPEELLRRADEKLYQAKREGKNRVVVG